MGKHPIDAVAITVAQGLYVGLYGIELNLVNGIVSGNGFLSL